MRRTSRETGLPERAGVGLKAEHYVDILDGRPDVGWFEVHPENYMGRGGPPHKYLAAIAERYPLSLHGVGLSIGSSGDLDRAHLDRLKALVDRYRPASFSEHLAWSSHNDGFLNDLLPLPYTPETLAVVCRHITQLQDHIGRHVLLENPATYVTFKDSVIDEIEFLSEIATQTGCGLLLDINNVFVSCTNHKRSPEDYVDRFPVALVGEIHLAGHCEDSDDAGERLLIDAHDRHVVEDVWSLYRRAIARAGPCPTLIEWDNDVPAWPILYAEAQLADDILHGAKAAMRADADALA